MMKVSHYFTASLTAPTPAVLYAVKGDGARMAVARLMAGAEAWTVPEGVTAGVSYTLPDKTPGYYDRLEDGTPACMIAGNLVSAVLAPVLTGQAGAVKVSIVLRDADGGQVATFPFQLRVEQAPGIVDAEGVPAMGSGFEGKLFYGGPGGALTALALGDGVRVETTEDGTLALVAEGGSGGGGGIDEEKDPTVPAWAKQPQKPAYTAQEVGAMPAGTKIPGKTSELTNDAGFVDKAVNDLANYYTKVQTQELIAAIPRFRVTVVQQLPAAGEELVLYLVPFATAEGQYLEYIWVDGRWEIIGSQRVDLTGYATEVWVKDYVKEHSGQNPPQDGEDGATFTPAVSEDGTLSWSNDKGLENPAPVNIKGPQGEQGPKGDTGATGPAGADGAKGEKGDRGEQGLQGIPGEKGDTGAPGADGAKGDKGDKGDTGPAGANGAQGPKGDQGEPGKDGADGAPGKDGVSATHSWNGTILTVTSASGTSSADLKGAKGDKGDTGATGPKGDKGDTGAAGKDGSDGYIPVRGADYWTPDDIAAIDADIATELAKRGQLKPEFAQSLEWLEENGDQTKLYVLPDGMIYAWMLTEKEVASGPAYTNLLPSATDTDRKTIYGGDYNGDGVNDGYKTATRLSSSGSTSSREGCCASGFISAKDGDIVRMKGTKPVSGVQAYLITYNSANTKVLHQGLWGLDDGSSWTNNAQAPWQSYDATNDVLTITLSNTHFGTGFNAFRVSCLMTSESIVTVNQEIKEGGGTTIVKEEAWASTGHAFVPADYEPRIIDLEKKTAQNTADIKALKKGAVDTDGVDALTWIRNWDSPIYDRVPVFQLSTENPAVTSAERTVASIYAKYDALVAAHPNYITKTDLGACSDGVTHVYRYDFCEPEPHHQSGMQWSETKPVVICASGIHWEWGGVYSLYYALKEIAENPELDDLRRNVHFVVVPIINPYCFTDIGSYNQTYGVLNANGVQIHRNFEVGFIYPGQSGYSELGTRNHGGTEPLSEIETKNIDNIFKEFPDTALFLTCHSAQRDTRWGTGFIWASTATNYTCNLGFRLVDKMSKTWHKKYGTTWEEGCVRENNFVLADPTTYPNGVQIEDGDYRAGHAHVSSTDGTETRQATKYGIQGANVEVLDTFWVLSDTALDSKLTTHGAEVYINYLLMYMGCYDHNDKRLYAPGV